MTTYCAVVKYALDATDGEKRAALRQGLQDCAAELIDLGATLQQVDDALEAARWAAEEESREVAPQV